MPVTTATATLPARLSPDLPRDVHSAAQLRLRCEREVGAYSEQANLEPFIEWKFPGGPCIVALGVQTGANTGLRPVSTARTATSWVCNL